MIKTPISRPLAAAFGLLALLLVPALGGIGATVLDATKEDDPADPNTDGRANAGETVRYTVKVNSIGADNTNLNLQDTLDARTMFDPVTNKVKSKPLAIPDNFSTLGNLTIVVPGPGLLGNDIDAENIIKVDGVFQHPPAGLPANDGLTTMAEATKPTTNGGTVSITANGGFTYNPPPGLSFPTDTFTYTVKDADLNTDTGTATITISAPATWFVDANAAPGGNGTQGAPFNSLAAIPPGGIGASGDLIYVAFNPAAYDGGVDLKAMQQLIGGGASLADILVTAPSEASLPGLVSAPTVTNTGGDGVSLATGNTVRGLNIGNTTGAGLSGSSFGTLTVNAVGISGNGSALDLDNGTLAVTLGSVSSTTTSGDGIDLESVGGSFTVSGQTTVNNGTGNGIDLRGTNAGATFNFNGGLDIDTTSGTGLLATGGGTITVANAGTTTVDTTGGTAVDIQNTTIGAGVTFQSVSVAGGGSGANVGINLSTTGSGAFTITGTGTTDGSGGTISGLTDVDGIRLSNTQGLVSLSNMQINNINGSADNGGNLTSYQSGADGIHAENIEAGLALDNVDFDNISDCAINGSPFATPVTFTERTTFVGLTLNNSTLTDTNRFHIPGNVGDDVNSVFRESMVRVHGVSGQVTIDNSSFEDGSGLVQLITADSGTARIDVTRSTFSQSLKEFTTADVSVGGAGLEVYVSGTVTADLIVGDLADTSSTPGNEFLNCGKGDYGSLNIRTAPNAPPFTGDLDVHVARNTFRVTDHSSDAFVAGQPLNVAGYQGFPQGEVEMVIGGNCTYEALFSNNTLDGCQGDNANLYGSSMSIIAGTDANGEVIVRNNTHEEVWGHISRADTDAADHFFHFIDNPIIRDDTPGNAAGTDVETAGFGTQQEFPYESIIYLTRNGAEFHYEKMNQDIPDHDTLFNFRSKQSIEFQAANNTDQLFIDFDAGAAANGFEFDNGVGASMNLFLDGAPAGSVDSVIDFQGTNRNGNPSNVQGTVTLSGTDPTDPTVSVP